MQYQYILLWAGLGVQLTYGEGVDSLRRVSTQSERLPRSNHTNLVRYRTYLALAGHYRWGSAAAPANMDSAIYFASQAISLAPDQQKRADALRLRGDLYSVNEWGYTSAWMGFEDLNQAGNLYIKLHDQDGLHQTYNTLSVIYLNRYNVRSIPSANTLHYRTLALQVQSDPSFQWPSRVEATPTDSAASPALFDQAIRVGEQNLAFWRQRGSKPHQMWRLEYVGGLYRQSGLDPIKGKDYQEQAVRLALELKDYPFQFPCLTNLAQWELDDGNYVASLRYAHVGLALARQLHSGFRQAVFHDRLYYTFRAMGNMDSAYLHKDANIAINDSLIRVGDQRQIRYLKDMYTAEKRQHELEQELQQQSSLLYLLTGIGGLLVSILVLSVWRNRLLRRKNEDLQAAVLQGQTLERQRVAADLHDNLGSTLSALQWGLEAIDKTKLTKPEQDVYATLSQQVSQAHNDVRLLSHNLLPDELAKQGLAATLRTLVEKMNRNTPVHFSLTGTDNLPRLDRQTEFELYSICLELLNNVLKHAQASEASIDIQQTNNTLHLTINDNGTGIDGQQSTGRGLQNIATRVESLAGTWVTNSPPGKGTQNRIIVPIKMPTRASSQT